MLEGVLSINIMVHLQFTSVAATAGYFLIAFYQIQPPSVLRELASQVRAPAWFLLCHVG